MFFNEKKIFIRKVNLAFNRLLICFFEKPLPDENGLLLDKYQDDFLLGIIKYNKPSGANVLQISLKLN